VLELEPRQLSGLLRAQQLGRGALGQPEEVLGVRAAVLRFGGLGLTQCEHAHGLELRVTRRLGRLSAANEVVVDE
jgi:hypothetical protein